MSMHSLSSRVVYRNRWMTVREDAIQRADGSAGIYAVVEKSDFALVIPRQDDQLYLVEQYRFPVGGRFIEFPQGTWELRPKADPRDVARGELQEETGLIAGQMDYLGHLFIAYGMSSQGFHVFLATQLEQGERNLESEEQDLVVKRLPVAEFESMIVAGTVKDSATVSAWGLLKLKQEKKKT